MQNSVSLEVFLNDFFIKYVNKSLCILLYFYFLFHFNMKVNIYDISDENSML